MQIDANGWAGHLVQLLGAGAGGMVILRVIDNLFVRANKKDDSEAAARSELRADMLDEIQRNSARVEKLESEFDTLRDRYGLAIQANAQLRAENIELRRRYHQLNNYVAQWVLTVDTFAEEMGIPKNKRPTIPSWVHIPIEGPTSDASATQP